MIFTISTRTSKKTNVENQKAIYDKGICQNAIKLNRLKYTIAFCRYISVRNSFPWYFPVAPLEKPVTLLSQVHSKSTQVTVASEVLVGEKKRELQIHTLLGKRE